MIYKDLEKIYKRYDVEGGDDAHKIKDKYQLTLIVSARARQISEQKSVAAALGGSEMYITKALDEVEHHRLNFEFTEQGQNAPENNHVVVES